MDYKFTSKNGLCPQCIAFGKRYWIQDKHIGGDAYEYCLMSLPAVRKKPEFQNKIELASWINGHDMEREIQDDTKRNELADFVISSKIVHDLRFCFEDCKLVKNKGRKFVLYKDSTIKEYIDPTQETGWFQTYLECLNVSKEILRRSQVKREGEQMRIFK